MDPVSALMILGAGGVAALLGRDWLDKRRAAQAIAERFGLSVRGPTHTLEGVERALCEGGP